VLYATLAALTINPRPPVPRELALVHHWLDSWNGAGLILAGMLRQGYAVELSGGPDTGWSVTFLPPGWSAARQTSSAALMTRRRGVRSESRRGTRSTGNRCRVVDSIAAQHRQRLMRRPSRKK
jgi:hypothetical protein